MPKQKQAYCRMKHKTQTGEREVQTKWHKWKRSNKITQVRNKSTTRRNKSKKGTTGAQGENNAKGLNKRTKVRSKTARFCHLEFCTLASPVRSLIVTLQLRSCNNTDPRQRYYYYTENAKNTFQFVMVNIFFKMLNTRGCLLK